MIKKIIICMGLLSACCAQEWKLNTSNPGKLAEFKQIFEKHGVVLSATRVDLEEIDAEPALYSTDFK